MDNNERENNDVSGLKEVLNVMLNESNIFFNNFNNLHTKAAALIAFHGATIMFALDKELLNIEKHDTVYQIVGIVLRHVLFFGILGLSVASILLCLIVLLSVNKARIAVENISDEALDRSEKDILKSEIKEYRKNIKENQKLLKKKHDIFDASVILTIIQVSCIAFTMLLQMIKI